MRHYKNRSLDLLQNYQQFWQSPYLEGHCSIKLGLHSRMHSQISLQVTGRLWEELVCQPSAASGVDRRAADNFHCEFFIFYHRYRCRYSDGQGWVLLQRNDPAGSIYTMRMQLSFESCVIIDCGNNRLYIQHTKIHMTMPLVLKIVNSNPYDLRKKTSTYKK